MIKVSNFESIYDVKKVVSWRHSDKGQSGHMKQAPEGALATGGARTEQWPIAPVSTECHTRIHHSGGGNCSFDPLQ